MSTSIWPTARLSRTSCRRHSCWYSSGCPPISEPCSCCTTCSAIRTRMSPRFWPRPRPPADRSQYGLVVSSRRTGHGSMRRGRSETNWPGGSSRLVGKASWRSSSACSRRMRPSPAMVAARRAVCHDRCSVRIGSRGSCSVHSPRCAARDRGGARPCRRTSGTQDERSRRPDGGGVVAADRRWLGGRDPRRREPRQARSSAVNRRERSDESG